MYLNYLRRILKDKEPEGGGEGGTPDLTVEELKNKIADLENQGTVKDGENSKLKKDLETLQKKLSKLENEGKTKEQLDKEEKEKVERELQEKTNEINLMKLEITKAKLVTENKISEHFTDLIILNPEMTENDLKVILNLAFYLENTDKLEWDILEHSNNYKIFKIGNRCFLQVHYPNMQIFELRSERYL